MSDILRNNVLCQYSCKTGIVLKWSKPKYFSISVVQLKTPTFRARF